MRIFVTLFLLTLSTAAAAGIYKWVQPDGSIIYSDRPPVENALPADLPPVQEIKVVPPASPASDTDSSEGSRRENSSFTYTSLEVTQPEDNGTLRDNSGQVSVQISIDPSLQAEDTIAILLDGKEIGQGKGTSMTISNVDRGRHTLQAVVKNAAGSPLKQSPAITFNLQRTSIQQRN